jgi:hypothetical protein
MTQQVIFILSIWFAYQRSKERKWTNYNLNKLTWLNKSQAHKIIFVAYSIPRSIVQKLSYLHIKYFKGMYTLKKLWLDFSYHSG